MLGVRVQLKENQSPASIDYFDDPLEKSGLGKSVSP
jgi:hypothetical protein